MTPDIRINWRGNGFSTITNEAFLTDTTGWAVTAGINAAATSITRVTADGVLGGVTTNTCAELVTTAISGSGAMYDFGTTTFTIGRTYRFSVYLKSVSGTTSAQILIGSLGTIADRASSNITLTTSWVRYTVDWTPSGTRTDAEAIVTNNAAAIMTARVCLAEVYETIDDIGPNGANEVDGLSFARGANFDGSSESPGTCTIRVTNIAQRYSPDNTGSSLTGLLTTGRPVLVRAVEAAVVYGAFHGTVRRLIPNPEDQTAEIMCEDRLYDLSRREVSLSVSISRSIQTFRGAILDDAGYTAAQRSLASGSPELDIPTTGADQRRALDVLAECNRATGSIHYIDPHPVPSVGWRYTVVDRTMLQTAAAVRTIVDTTSPGVTGLSSYDVTDEAVVNDQRVMVTTRTLGATATVWESADVPFTVPASTTVDVWASFTDPTFSQAAVYTSTNTPTVTLTAFSRSAKISFTAGVSASTVSALSVTGRGLTMMSAGSERATTGAADRRGTDIDTELVDTRAVAKGLADWVILRYGAEKPRPALTLTNDTITTDVGDTIELTFGLLTITAKRYIVRSLSTTVDTNARVWRTTYDLEAGLADTLLFTIDGTAAEGVGGTGILAT